MKKTNPDRSRGGKTARSGPVESAQEGSAYALSAAEGAGQAAAQEAGGGRGSTSSEAFGAPAGNWNRYCDSRLKQFCMR